MEYAIVHSDQTVNAAYYSEVNLRLRRYRNAVVSQRQTGPCGCTGNAFKIITLIQKSTLL